MSLAGVRSSRGDVYQVCIAVEWAIRMIKDASIAWMELDSTRVIAGGIPAPVDDLILGWDDGRETCCQCKKNQPGFTAWRIADIEDDIKKAADHLIADPNARVRFYSRADFGDLGRLVDRALQMPDLTAFMSSVPKDLVPELSKLQSVWVDALTRGTRNVHDLLLRISFHPTLSVDDYPAQLKVDLGQVVTRVDDAYNALWTTLDNLGARTASGSLVADRHRISRAEMLQLLYGMGCVVAPPRLQADIQTKLTAMSKVGRGWRREIAGQRVDRQAVGALIVAAETKVRVLLTDGPGAGKTCVLLELVEQLESRHEIATLFLQAREFADASDHEGRVALGLDPDIPALVSGMSQWKRVIVVIDSLDVLSLNRESECLTFFLSLIDRLAAIPNVCVIAACRTFDLQYNRKLAGRTWDVTVEAGMLDWDAVVEPLLTGLGIDATSADTTTRALLGNPRNLALFTDVAAKSQRRNVSGAQELAEAYLDVVVAGEPELGSAAMVAIETMAREMLSKRRHQLPRSRIVVDDSMLRRLCSANVLFESERHEFGYGHQTLLDALAVRDAIRRGLTLLDFIQSLQPVPFIRPAIRSFFTHLRLGDRSTFRMQVRSVFEGDVAFHVKRLIAESYAACEPDEGDWSLIRHLFRSHPAHFRSIYDAGRHVCWHHFWMRNLVPMLQTEGNAVWLEIHFIRLRDWSDADPAGVFAFWTWYATSQHAKGRNLRGQLGIVLHGFKHLTEFDAQPLLEALVNSPPSGHDFLGNALITWAQHDARGDALVWRYVTSDVPIAPKTERDIEEKLHCDETSFRDINAFAARLAASDVLLGLSVSSLELWSASLALGPRPDPGAVAEGPNTELLDETTFGITHSNHQLRHTSAIGALVQAIEKAILKRAGVHDDWWKASARRICLNDCGGLRHIGMIAMTQFPEANAEVAKDFFEDDRRPQIADSFELGNLIAAVAPFLGDGLALVEQHIFHRLQGYLPKAQRWVDQERYGLLCRIPLLLRSDAVRHSIERMAAELAPPDQHPGIYSSSGAVGAPFAPDEVTSLSDAALVSLLVSSQGLGRGPQAFRELTGGAESVDRLLHTAAGAEPRRFLKFLTGRWFDLPEGSKLAIFGGAADYLLFRYGQVSASYWKPKEDVEANALVELLLVELERHPSFWTGTRQGATALRGCAGVVAEDADLERVVFLATAHITADDPPCGERQDDDLTHVAINSSRGDLAEGLMFLAERLLRADRELPPLLGPTLMRLARDCHPAVRASVIGKVAYMQTKTELGWQLFDAAFSDDDQRVWAHGADSLYYATGKLFVRAKPYLDRMEESTVAGVRKAWGRLSALAVLGGQISRELLLEKLAAGAEPSAWEGAISVWVANAGYVEYALDCFTALEQATKHAVAREPVLRQLGGLFKPTLPIAKVPLSLFRAAYVEGVDGALAIGNLTPRLDEWLCHFAEVDPDETLELVEIVASICMDRGSPFYDPAPLGTLLTLLFREAEEREGSDGGQMLRRVVAVQDAFLSVPTSSLGEWLRAAERPDA